LHTGFWCGNLRERATWKTQAWIILKWIFRKWDGGMDWIDLAQDMERWWAVVNVVMNFRVPRGIS